MTVTTTFASTEMPLPRPCRIHFNPCPPRECPGQPHVDDAFALTAAHRDGFGPTSDYFNRYWPAILGPTTTLLWPRLVMRAAEGCTSVDVHEMAAELGVQPSVLRQCIKRLVTHRFAAWDAVETLVVMDACLRLGWRGVDALPEHLRQRHLLQYPRP